MAPGAAVRIRNDVSRYYRKPGEATSGVVRSVSPTGHVARVRMDDVADSYVLVDHLEQTSLAAARAA